MEILNPIFMAPNMVVLQEMTTLNIHFALSRMKRDGVKRMFPFAKRDINSRHFRQKLVYQNESKYCAPIDRAFYNQPFLSYERFCEINCAVFWTK